MLNRNHGDQFTLFGRGFKRFHLNWANTAFFFLVACLGGRELKNHSHEPGSLDTPSEKFFMLLTYLSLMFYILVNKKQIGNCFRATHAALIPDHPVDPARHIVIAMPAEEKFTSKTLDTCLERSKRIAQKIQKMNESKAALIEAFSNEFECPISLQLMKCPVVASDGVTYDYDSIYPVIQTTRKSPITREILSTSLSPLPLLQDKIETWVNSQIEKFNKQTNDNHLSAGKEMQSNLNFRA